MKIGRSGLITICLIIIILACQLLPIVPNAQEYFDSNGTAEGLQINSNPLHNSIPIIDHSETRHIPQKIPVRKPDGGIYRCESTKVFHTESVIPVQPVDMRSTIRETISQYFNGSKYKTDHLKIIKF